MPRNGLRTLAVIATMMAASATLAQDGIHWQQDIEVAKNLARQSNRLVLVHVWGDGCAPCKALESNVFNQPGVAGAIEQAFVPVKLNANEFPATAQGFGITRIPTDVVITPEGQVIGKMISPATPAAYVSEMTQVASRYHSQLGQAYQLAAAKAPQPKVLNPAYADLTIGTPAVPPAATNMPSLPVNTTPSIAPPATGSVPFVPAAPQAAAANPYSAPAPALTPAAPAAITNPLVGDRYATPTTPGPAPTAPQPAHSGNPYVPYGASPAPTAAIPVSTNQYASPPAPVQPTQPVTGYDTSTAAPPATSPAADPAVAPYPTATQPAVASTASATPQLPPGAPPLGFDGFCPVSMRTAWKWVPGDTKFGAIHRGRTYIFAGTDEQQKFLANPDFYSPALAGSDPVMAIDHKQNVPGLREHSVDYDNQFFLFSSEATLQQFTANPQRYVSGVRQAMGMTAGPVR